MDAPPAQYTTTSDGVSIAWAEAGQGPALLQIPAAPFTHVQELFAVFEAYCDAYARSFRLVTFDARGTGMSERDVAGVSAETLLVDALAVIDAAKLDRFIVMASSGILTVSTCLRIATAFPERVTHVVLDAPYLNARELADTPFGRTGMALAEADWTVYVQTLVRVLLGWDSATSDMIEPFARAIGGWVDPAVGIQYGRAGETVDVGDLLPHVRQPTLVLRNDPYFVPARCCQRVAAKIPGARYRQYADPTYAQETELVHEFVAPSASLLAQDAPTAATGTAVILSPDIVSSTEPTLVPRPPAAKAFASGRYTVRRVLGEGGQKVVYLVHDEALDRDCALSVIKAELLEPDDLERLRREAQAMARLGAHSNIVTVHDIGDEDGKPYLVCEYVPAGELRRHLRDAAAPLPLERALAIAGDIARALAIAHGRGVIHRDVKPANVWLCEDGSAKLGDFGLAFSLDRSRLTMPGTVMGTAAYLSPEQALGEPVTERSDLYALGRLLYEMVCGRPPFADANPTAVISQHLNAAPPAPSSHKPDVPPALEELILRLLSKSPARRPESASAVLEELRRIGDSATPLTSGIASPSPSPGGNDADAGASEPAIQYTHAVDGVSIAWWEAGDGYPLIDVHTPPFSNIRLDWQNIPFHQRLAERFRLIRFDTRGSGLSQRDAADVSVDAMVADMEAVVAAAKIERFAIFSDTGAAPLTIAYALKYPNRVSHLVLFNPYLDQRELFDTPRMKALLSVMEQDWELYTEGLASTMYGWESGDETRGVARLLRDSVEPDMARKVFESLGGCDMTPLLGSVRVPTLVLHPSSSEFPSLRASQLIAASIPGARLRTGTAGEPWSHEVETSTVDAVWGFVGMSRPPAN